MRRVRLLRFIFAAGGAVLAPLCALGHGSEFLVAKLKLQAGAPVQLEVTADFGQNPLLADEAAARAALLKSVQIRQKGHFRPLDEKSVVWREGGKWEDAAPPAILPAGEDSGVHALITARWEWPWVEDTLVFQVPKGSLHDVLLWMPAKDGSAPKWMMLLGGDVTREIPVPRESRLLALVPATGSGIIAAMSLSFYHYLHLIGLILVFVGFGGLFSKESFRSAMKWHGIGLVISLVSGFGMLAKMGIMGSMPWWVWVKIALWLVLGGLPVLAKRRVIAPGVVVLLAVIIGAVLAFLGYTYKTGFSLGA